MLRSQMRISLSVAPEARRLGLKLLKSRPLTGPLCFCTRATSGSPEFTAPTCTCERHAFQQANKTQARDSCAGDERIHAPRERVVFGWSETQRRMTHFPSPTPPPHTHSHVRAHNQNAGHCTRLSLCLSDVHFWCTRVRLKDLTGCTWTTPRRKNHKSVRETGYLADS